MNCNPNYSQSSIGLKVIIMNDGVLVAVGWQLSSAQFPLSFMLLLGSLLSLRKLHPLHDPGFRAQLHTAACSLRRPRVTASTIPSCSVFLGAQDSHVITEIFIREEEFRACEQVWSLFTVWSRSPALSLLFLAEFDYANMTTFIIDTWACFLEWWQNRPLVP